MQFYQETITKASRTPVDKDSNEATKVANFGSISVFYYYGSEYL